MIAEDEWLIASDLKAQLNDLGYEVVGMASSAEEALSLAAQNAPDVAIMNIHLGGRMKGTEAAKRLHDEFRIPSIFLTSYTDTATFTAAQTSQPFAFLAKPHHGTELYIAIQLALKARQSALRG